MVPAKVCSHCDFLRSLSSTRSAAKHRVILNNASDAEIEVLVECFRNICRGNFALTKAQRRRARPHVSFARTLASTVTVNGARKKVQRGAGAALPAILVPLVLGLARTLAK